MSEILSSDGQAEIDALIAAEEREEITELWGDRAARLATRAKFDGSPVLESVIKESTRKRSKDAA